MPLGQQEAVARDNQEALKDYHEAPAEALKKCRRNLGRIEAGLKLLEEDAQAGEAFAFMNRAMWLQRTHSLYSEQVRRGGQPDFDKDIDVPANRTWFPFQIAFILLNLPGITRLDHPDHTPSVNDFCQTCASVPRTNTSIRPGPQDTADGLADRTPPSEVQPLHTPLASRASSISAFVDDPCANTWSWGAYMLETEGP